jgi:hypothetical protein
MTEAERLREENARLRRLLIQHGIEIPEPPSKDGIPSATQTASVVGNRGTSTVTA